MTGWVRVGILLLLFLAAHVHAMEQDEAWQALTDEAGELYQEGRVESAIEAAQGSLVLAERAWGTNHPAVATSLNILGFLNYDLGRYGEAESFYDRSLAVWENVGGADRPECSAVLNNLTLLYHETKRYAEAEKAGVRAL